ncbi:hypothetical protein [Clostridium fungisolvens]|uniref:Uncharacterized protein n=1 Tax=Clostridium fungisolvens TaxID=1604897 RepID=A0A6V8SGV0_9CLOT|nr:hypothetical protein [Clostridium fungisolvens]GFP76280.1 hypothetical protein bsdtw1_02382 [Clostridium fungisolvens]
MKRINIILSCLFILCVIISAYVGFAIGNNIKKDSKLIDYSNTTWASIHIKTIQHMPSGIACSITLKNNSDYVIKQNSLYVRYTITEGNSARASEAKFETTGNKLDIKPNEEVLLFCFIPLESYKDNKNIDVTRLQYEIKGYLNEVTTLNHFTQAGYFPKEELQPKE